MAISHISVVAETNHGITFAFFQGNAPFDVTGRVYAFKIVDDPLAVATSVTFTPNVVSNEVELIGDCSTLTPGVEYQYQLAEDGNAILTGTVLVVPRFA